jgi:peptidyl-prolyl cis-trans isomerase SurA
MSRLRHRALAAGLAVSTLIAAIPSRSLFAEPREVVLVDRIVAVVDDDVITLGELEKRAKPYLVQLPSSPAETALVAHAHMRRQVLDHLIEERLVAEVAADEQLGVTPEEIERAIEMVREGQKLDEAAFAKAIHDAGMSDEEYREEIGRQLLDGKIVMAKVAPRLGDASKLTPEDYQSKLDAGRRAYIQELKEKAYVEIRL